MFIEGKRSVDKVYPVRLVDSVDLVTPETGKVFGGITCVYGFEDAVAETAYVVTAALWKEQGDGNYWLTIGAGEFTTAGKYIVKIECAGCADFNFVIEIRKTTVNEIGNIVQATNEDF